MLSHLESGSDFLRTIYSPFFLSVFFFSSGYVYKHKDNFKTFLIKKVKGLLWPWFIFSILNIALSHVLTFNEHTEITTELLQNFMQVRGYGDQLWFIAALFAAFIPFYFLVRWHNASAKKNKDILFFVIVLILSMVSKVYSRLMNPELFPWKSTDLPWHLDYIFVAMFYMAIGYLFRIKLEEKFDKCNTRINRTILIAVYLVIVFFPSILNIELSGIFSFCYNYIISLLGIAAVISLCKVLPNNKYVSFVGQNTLTYFALHGKVYSLLQTLFRKFFGEAYAAILSNAATSSLFAIILTLLMSVILIIPAYIINRYLPFLLGRKLQKKGTKHPQDKDRA